ncbi:MAG TPA: hypothetical protein VGX50_07960 [Longimicrobium sp.]|jgi:hypothetical protein|nr:hypothetical protein [Longimicrobium sp.]
MLFIPHPVRGFALALACAAAPLCAGPLPAQLPLSVEARGGVALPAAAFEGAEGGQGGEVSATWHVLPFAGIYGAYQSNRFAYGDTGGHATDEGFAAGVRITLPALLVPIDPWIRGGVVAHQLKTEARAAESGVGYEVGAGLGFPLARGIALTPGVLWTRYRDGDLLRVRHLRADVGLRMRF